MEEQPNRTEPVGAPSEYADGEEVPNWFSDIVMAITAFPIFVGFLCGGIPLGCGALWCILSFLI